jgi:hypothetical protein
LRRRLDRVSGRRASAMSCEHLVCAACAGPVDEGRCPTCRAARAHLHHEGLAALPPAALVAVVALVALMLLLLTGHY